MQPNAIEVADTLGWVLYQKGAYQSAVDLFQEALKLGEKSKAPDDATVHYHLGLAYVQTGAKGKARAAFEQALAGKKDFEGQAEARRALSGL
jgi:Flp pilus assembly protein TadD